MGSAMPAGRNIQSLKKIVEVAPVVNELGAAEGSLLERKGQEPRCGAANTHTPHLTITKSHQLYTNPQRTRAGGSVVG